MGKPTNCGYFVAVDFRLFFLEHFVTALSYKRMSALLRTGSRPLLHIS